MPALGQRVTLLEEQMQDQAKELRAESRDLRAEMDRRFDRVDQRFDRMDQRLDRMDQKIDRHFIWFVGMFVTLVLGLVGLSLQISRLSSI
jgi:hypothetical protein